MACLACSALALSTIPTTCDGCDGFVDLIFSAVFTSWPLMYIGYSRPNSLATFLSAASIAARFSAFVKSTKGSLVNSVFCSFASAVAIRPSPGTFRQFYDPRRMPTSDTPPGQGFLVRHAGVGPFSASVLGSRHLGARSVNQRRG